MVLLGSAFGQHLQTDFDHQANYSQYKTYSWQEIKASNSLWGDRIKEAVNAQLGSKGWIQVDSGGNVVIVAIKTTQTERTLQTFYDGMGVVGAGEALAVSVNLPPRSRITRKERL
jgi:hypothetical protein